MKKYKWVQCPDCMNSFVDVGREISDTGGTERLLIECNMCENTNRVIP